MTTTVGRRPHGDVAAVRPTWQVVSRPTTGCDQGPTGPGAPDRSAPARVDVLVATDQATGPRPPDERLHELFDRTCRQLGRREARRRLAVDYGDVAYSYAELGQLANRLAHFLRRAGVGADDRVGLLLDRTITSHASVLALSKLGAAYVPLDAGFPDDRIAYMLDDAGVTTVLTLSRFGERFAWSPTDVIELDTVQHLIARCPPEPPETVTAGRPGGAKDPVCYIIYTSGSTGRPKGVPIRHSSICSFIRVAADAYGYRPSDRVYQGMTIAFDFSVEELWVPLAVGATLVPAPGDLHLVGSDLAEFLVERRITALCCVPTLLATIDRDLPNLRFLLVSGEACPPDLIEPWLSPDRRVLNAYGPTETTVTATWSVLALGRPVTIGGPLPTYSIVILDPDGSDDPLPAGQVGEIVVGGIGVAEGYLNQPERTARSFIADPVGPPSNPTGRWYRTGDLGRITVDDEIEFLGRIDTQVKIRGYRIELDEIASVARGVDAVGQAVIEPYDPTGSGPELVAYLTGVEPDRPIDIDAVHQSLVRSLPAYMIPTYYEVLEALPLLPSTKVDRHALPPPNGPRFLADRGEQIAPRTEAEAVVAGLLASILEVDSVSVEADFFDDLGADSLRLAELATAVRAELGVKRLSMRRLYEHPTVAQVAALVDPESPPVAAQDRPTGAPGESPPPDPKTPPAPVPPAPGSEDQGPRRRDGFAFWATGAAQVSFYLLMTFAAALATVAAVGWVDGADGPVALYLRAVVAGSAIFFGGGMVLLAVKWLAVGRFGVEPIALWSPDYLRFWVARSAIRLNPFNVLAGTPAYNGYLRALGLQVGRDAVILIPPPICTDLVSIGTGAVIREECLLTGYTARRGFIHPGPVVIGHGAVIGEASVLDIGTEVGDRAVVGPVSCLAEGQRVPVEGNVQGSPAQPSNDHFDRVERLAVNRGRRAWFTLTQLTGIVLVTGPIWLAAAVVATRVGLSVASATPMTGTGGGIADLLVAGGALYLGGLMVAGLTVSTIPRLLHPLVKPGVAHPLYGFQWRLARAVRRYSNNVVLNTIFGDSSMIVAYLRVVGYDLTRSTQTGSNFGVDQRHHDPFLCTFDRNTLVSDGLRMLNMEISATSFEVRPIAMPPDTYVGNDVRYPAGAKVGAGCLIATKAAVPTDGPLRQGVGLLGSPAFDIPRSVARDLRFEHYKQPGVLEKRLRLKLRSNLVTLGIYVVRSWLLVVWTMALSLGSFGLLVTGRDSAPGLLRPALAVTMAAALSLSTAAVISILFERLVRGFRPLTPLYCSLYDRRFWNHERFWKLNYNAFLRVFDGTPFKPSFVRLQGARIGRRVFDDGAGLTEPTLVEIGHGTTLNFGSTVQCHSLEDGTFKSDRTRIGADCTLGVGAFVHYGVTIEPEAIIDADSFLMKGSTVPADATWRGNPARHVSTAGEPVDGDPTGEPERSPTPPMPLGGTP